MVPSSQETPPTPCGVIQTQSSPVSGYGFRQVPPQNDSTTAPGSTPFSRGRTRIGGGLGPSHQSPGRPVELGALGQILLGSTAGQALTKRLEQKQEERLVGQRSAAMAAVAGCEDEFYLVG